MIIGLLSVTLELISNFKSVVYRFTFVSSLLRQLDVVRVGLKYSHSPPAGPLHRRALGGGLAEAGNLGGGSGHAAVRSSRLYACRKIQA